MPSMPSMFAEHADSSGDARMLARAIIRNYIADTAKLIDAREVLQRIVNDPKVRPGTLTMAAQALATIELRLLDAALSMKDGDENDAGASITFVFQEAAHAQPPDNSTSD